MYRFEIWTCVTQSLRSSYHFFSKYEGFRHFHKSAFQFMRKCEWGHLIVSHHHRILSYDPLINGFYLQMVLWWSTYRVLKNRFYQIQMFYPKHAEAKAHKDDCGLNADLADHHSYETPLHLLMLILMVMMLIKLLMSSPSLHLFHWPVSFPLLHL